MKILEARTRTAAIGRPVRNAAIGFEAMTASALALVTDRGTGYAFDSIGRYGRRACCASASSLASQILHCKSSPTKRG